MKLLLSQYEDILVNFKLTENATEDDLSHAICQFTTHIVGKSKLLDLKLKKTRVHCKCDVSNLIQFIKIDGGFCPNCGFIFPF